MHGKLPDYCHSNNNNNKAKTAKATHSSLKMIVLYFSSTLLLQVDERTNCPVPFKKSIFLQKLRQFVSVFIQTSLLFSVLLANDYQIYPQHDHVDNLFLYCASHLGNAFLLASLTSLVLDGGASGLGLLTSCVTGYTLEHFSDSPLTKSTSPSDFWGRRWDRPVQSALRRGCYQPLCDYFGSAMAAFGTFVVSGFIHEYVLLAMSFRGQHTYRPRYGMQFAFFLWNGIVLMLERTYRRLRKTRKDGRLSRIHGQVSSMLASFPQPVQTALVLMTVLPIGHWFTDEYIGASFYDDASWGFPILVVVD